MKRVIFLILPSLFAVSVLFAQVVPLTSAEREVPPAPVVSGLNALCTGNTVTLSWMPAPGIEGESLIFRAQKPITAANYYAAEKRGEVPYTATTFQDTIEDGQDYYYAVLSRDRDGTLYEFFLPVSNSLLVAVTSGPSKATAEETRISTFDTITRNDAVIITWKSSIRNKPLVLYRSTSSFTGMNSLVQAIVVSSFSDTGTPYVDYPVPGVPYYYALLDEDTIRSGTVHFVENENTNRIPVEIPSSFARIQRINLPSLRPMPLPFLNVSHTAAVQKWQFSPETEKIISSLTGIKTVRRDMKRSPYVFLSDIKSVSGGEEYSLKKILETNFTTESWDAAITSLKDFLAIRRTEETTARTHFYLGEAYYFTGNYRAALLELLLAQDTYYNQSREWIHYVLEKMGSLI